MTHGKTRVFGIGMVKSFVGAVVGYDVTMHLYLLWNIWSKCLTRTSYNLKMKITLNKPAKDRNACYLKNI